MHDISLSDYDDSTIWWWNNNGRFSVRSANNFLIYDGVKDCKIFYLWKLKVPLKIKLFMWLAARNRVLIADTPAKRGWYSPSIRVLCSTNEDNLEDIFFCCTYAISMWNWLLQSILTTQHLMTDLSEDITTRWWVRMPLVGLQKNNFDLCFTTTCWELWKQRNMRIFNEHLIRTKSWE